MEQQFDWQIGKTIKERMKYMLDNQVMCDIMFRVGQDQSLIQAHRFMLKSASPVFHCMLEGPLAEKGEILIPDIELDNFKQILQ